MRRWPALLLFVVVLACNETSALAPDETHSPSRGPRIVFRIRPGRFLCGLPPDESGRTCLFIPEDGAAP